MELNPLLQAQAKPLSKGAAVALRRKCACGTHTIGGGECDKCGKQRQLQRRPAGEQTAVQEEVPAIVHDVLRSPGQPLDAATRSYMEPRFDHDFSRVRVHTGARAAESAQAVHALAYTVGRDVVFGAGQYAPWTSAGQRLLAHELTHVAQQKDDGAAVQGKLAISQPHDAAEREADGVAESISRPTASGEAVSAMRHEHSAKLHRSCFDGRCGTCAGGQKDFWVTAFFRRRATRDTMTKLRTEINGAKAIFANCCLNLKFDFNWTLLRGGGALPAYEGNPAGEWHFTADEAALGTGTTFSGARGIPMLVVDDVPRSGGGVTVGPRFDARYTGRNYFAIGINQTSTPNPNCNPIAHELWHVSSGQSAHDPANGTVTSCTGAGVSATYCNGLRAMV